VRLQRSAAWANSSVSATSHWRLPALIGATDCPDWVTGWSAGLLLTRQRSARLRRSLRNPLIVGFELRAVELAQARLGALEKIARRLRGRRQARWATVGRCAARRGRLDEIWSRRACISRADGHVLGPGVRLHARPEPVRRASCPRALVSQRPA
jgi:hypothetical protein